MAVSTFTNPSPTLPQVSLYAIPPKPFTQTVQTSTSLPFSSPSQLSEDSLTIEASAQAVALASAAALAAREAVSSALALTEMAFPGRNESQFRKDENSMCFDSDDVDVSVGSKKKRRRMKKVPKLVHADCWSHRLRRRPSKSANSRYLTPEEEAEFALSLKEGARLEATRKKIREAREDDPSMSQWAEAAGMKKESLEKLLWRVREARERIILSYKRLVVSIATPHLGKGLSLQDLVQEGCMGLLQGAERFDPTKGYKLSTYAYWWIKQAIVRAIVDKSRIIRLPGNVRNKVGQIAEANNVLHARLGRLPTYDEIARMVGMEVSILRTATETTRLPLSMDQPLSHRGSLALKEIVPGPEETRPEIMVERQLMKKDVGRLLKTLCEREEYIIRLHFGLNGETARSCEEIGKLLNLSRERVRQLNCIALSKLRETSSINDFRVYTAL